MYYIGGCSGRCGRCCGRGPPVSGKVPMVGSPNLAQMLSTLIQEKYFFVFLLGPLGGVLGAPD